MPDVVVVGAGFAGLSAATALVEAGATVLVLEARPGLGGRASSFRDPGTGELVDNGQHVLLGCCHETLRFFDRIGAADAIHRQEGLAVSMIDRAGVETTLSLPPLPSPLHLAGGILAWRALTLRDRLSLLRIAPALLRARRQPAFMEGTASAVPPGTPKRGALQREDVSPSSYVGHPLPGSPARQPRWGGLPGSPARQPRWGGFMGCRNRETVRQWLVRHGQSARLCELLWEPLALAALNQPIDHAAAESFIAVLARMFGPDTGDAALILPARPLSELYAEPARRWIEARGGRVQTQAPAKVMVDFTGVTGVRVRDGQSSVGSRQSAVGSQVVPCRTVIAAVPWFALGDLFDETPSALRDTLAAAATTPPQPIVTVNLWLDRPVLEGPLIGLPGRTFQWVFDRRTIVGDGASHLSLVSSGAAAVVEMANDELAALALREIRAAIPAARAAVVRKASAVRERRATFSLAPGLPARPSTDTPVRGLYLAGDWIDTGLPATIESAVISGHRAAIRVKRRTIEPRTLEPGTLEPANSRTFEP